MGAFGKSRSKTKPFKRKPFGSPTRTSDTHDQGPDDAPNALSRPDKPKKIKKPWNPLNYLLWLQGRREHSRAELKQKLVNKIKEKQLEDQHDPEAILDRLSELGLQSDQRFLEGNVRMAASGGRGPGWVKQRLYRHQLDSEAVSEALASVEDEHWEREAYALARRRFGIGPYSMPLRMKAGNFLIRRGYSIDLSRKITGNEWPEEAVD